MRFFCLIVLIALAVADKPEYGTEHCHTVLQTDCSGYTDEPVCVFNGHTHTTYMNSCEFAHGICSHHGHSFHAAYEGPCVEDMTTPSP